MKGSGRGAHAFALHQNVGDVFAADGLKGEGVLDGASELVGAVDFAQGHDLLNVRSSIEAAVLQLAAKQLGLRAKIEEGQQESLIAGPFALRQQVLGMVRMGLVLTPVVTADVSGDQFFVVENVEL